MKKLSSMLITSVLVISCANSHASPYNVYLQNRTNHSVTIELKGFQFGKMSTYVLIGNFVVEPGETKEVNVIGTFPEQVRITRWVDNVTGSVSGGAKGSCSQTFGEGYQLSRTYVLQTLLSSRSWWPNCNSQ